MNNGLIHGVSDSFAGSGQQLRGRFTVRGIRQSLADFTGGLVRFEPQAHADNGFESGFEFHPKGGEMVFHGGRRSFPLRASDDA